MSTDRFANHDREIIGVITTISIIALTALGLRFMSKLIKRIAVGTDDLLLAFAFPRRRSQFSFYFGISRFRLTVLVLIGIVVAWWFSAFFAGLLICLPIESAWNPAVKGHCGNQRLLNEIVAVPWILTDFAILIAPLPVIGRLHLKKVTKIGLLALFLIGGLTCVVSCIRYSRLYYSSQDVIWDITFVTIWNGVEANITITCASLISSNPALAYLVPEKLIPRTGQWWSQYRSSQQDGKTKSSSGRGLWPFSSSTHLREPRPRLSSSEESVEMNRMEYARG